MGPNASRCLHLRAPAKVNLYLEIRGRRDDGYHNLRMFNAPVRLWDELTIERLVEPNRIEVSCAGDPAVPGGEGNLCARAARYYLDETSVRAGVRVHIRKTVPSGAGLGGGSSDAAATLMGLERIFERPLSADARARAAFRVGADIPFFLARSAAWVEGIGEVVRPAPRFDPLWLVLVHPGISLSTAEVFSRWNRGLTSPKRPPTISQFSFQGFLEGLRNDLEGAAAAMEPAVAEALEALASAGAPGCAMSGAGSTVFGLFSAERAARRVAGRVKADARARRWRVVVVDTLLPGRFPFLDD